MPACAESVRTSQPTAYPPSADRPCVPLLESLGNLQSLFQLEKTPESSVHRRMQPGNLFGMAWMVWTSFFFCCVLSAPRRQTLCLSCRLEGSLPRIASVPNTHQIHQAGASFLLWQTGPETHNVSLNSLHAGAELLELGLEKPHEQPRVWH
eukprot:3186520-Rhodomonas_salina.1